MDYLVHHLLQSSAATNGSKEALVYRDKRLTYNEIDRKASGLAHGLIFVGLNGRDRVGIYLGKSIEQVISIFGISKAGGVFVPINDNLLPNQVNHIAEDCRMKGLITDSGKFIELREKTDLIHSLDYIVVVGKDETQDLDLPCVDFEVLCDLQPVQISGIRTENDLAALLYTSGSTGKPKGIMLSHANIVAGAAIVSEYLEITESERILAILPFSFDAGLNQLTTGFRQGATVVLSNFVFARSVVSQLLAERITLLAGVPTIWAMLVQESSGLHEHDFPNLRCITNTGGAMPNSVLESLIARLPTTHIFLMYGLTEAFRSTYLPPAEVKRRPNSIGKAIPNTEIFVVSEDGQLCGPGEIGELVHRGPTVSMGYWGHKELNERTFRPHPFLPQDEGGTELVCYSGDLVKMDEEGYLYFVGRRDTMIKSSGFRISPTEVEEALFSSGYVKNAAVIGVPDPILGQAVKAYVVPKNGNGTLVDALIDHCMAQIPRYMVPREVEILDELPINGNGKVDYPLLRRRGGSEPTANQ